MRYEGRELRHKRVRKNVIGTSVKPRLCVSRSIKHISAQLIDDIGHKTLYGLSTNSPVFKDKIKSGGNVKAAITLGGEFAKSAVAKGFSACVFDRAGFRYHGRVKALAEAARKNGLKF
ncbi:MAG: 50S ribosomal protein L18 [Candidatus Omnitrophica bacterium]|nr:50S ribosomal protein L18 [Candidatus Omnitrophota bacterium]